MDVIDQTMDWLAHSASPYHVVALLKKELASNGFLELDEKKPFEIERGKSYFVTRNGSSLIAFKVPKNPLSRFKVCAAHTDSPTLKVKPNPIVMEKNLAMLNVEPYGGALYSTWFDRPLAIAGRVFVQEENGVKPELFLSSTHVQIPSLCIHMNRNANSQSSFNPTQMLPVLAISEEPFDFKAFLQKELGTEKPILSFDLFLQNLDEPRLLGPEKEFLSSPRLDDLSSLYTCLLGFEEASETDSVDFLLAFDNEEVGSLTRQGANSTFFRDVLSRVSNALFEGKEALQIGAANGFLMSVDNAHANHPNFASMSDPTTDVRLNEGIVLKYNAAQKYTTDGFSSSLVKALAAKAGIKVSEYTNRSDLPGGSTLGNLSNGEISFASADIGIAQLAMHGSNEFCGSKDLVAMERFIQTYFSTSFTFDGEEIRF